MVSEKVFRKRHESITAGYCNRIETHINLRIRRYRHLLYSSSPAIIEGR